MKTTKTMTRILAILSIITLAACTSAGPKEVLISMKSSSTTMEVGKRAEMSFSITDEQNRPIKDLQIEHERILHAIIIGEDFQEFHHVHPEDLGPITDEMKQQANFRVGFWPKKSGRYLVATDFSVNNEHHSERFFVQVTGTPEMSKPENDLSVEKTFGDYQVQMKKPATLITGEPQKLSFTISRNGEPVKDLQPYLGAPMHFAVVNDYYTSFVHTHGTLPAAMESMGGMDHSTMNHEDHSMLPAEFGPAIDTEINFPEKGRYHVFGQFNHEGSVMVIRFQVIVE